ncbi:MAG: ABC transporter permease [Candidatus Marinimicrobia bacterium]|nr:ABC transporter permease [Candidatus Neomarinimicrobiota bacterium]
MKIRESSALILPPYFFLTVFFILPVLIILILSFTHNRDWSQGITLKNYLLILDPLYLKVLIRSLIFAVLATLGSLLIGLPMAYYISFSNPKRKILLTLLVLVPFWTNFLVRIFAWFTILGRQGLINSFLLWSGIINEPLQLLHTSGAVVLGLVYGEIPFMILPIIAAMDRMDISLLEAATNLGANRFMVFKKLVLPLASPGIIAGSIFVFIPALGSFVVPDILGGRDSFMIGNTIKNQFMTVRDWSFGSSLSIILMVLVLLGVSAYLRQGRDQSMTLGEYL